MPRVRPLFFAPLLLALAGCGGSSGSSIFLAGNDGTVNLTFSSASGYNGSTTPFDSFTTLSGTADNTSASIAAANTTGSRTIQVFFAVNNLPVGTTVDLTGTTGSTVAYAESTRQWGGATGTITLVSRTATGLTLQLNNVVLSNTTGGSTGTVTVNGTLSFVSV